MRQLEDSEQIPAKWCTKVHPSHPARCNTSAEGAFLPLIPLLILPELVEHAPHNA